MIRDGSALLQGQRLRRTRRVEITFIAQSFPYLQLEYHCQRISVGFKVMECTRNVQAIIRRLSPWSLILLLLHHLYFRRRPFPQPSGQVIFHVCPCTGELGMDIIEDLPFPMQDDNALR
jgi:hypothetical protein